MHKYHTVLAVCIIILSACQQKKETTVAALPNTIGDKSIQKVKDSICIAAVGDIMLGTSYPDNLSLPPNNATGSFMQANQYLKNADIAFGNLEGTLLDGGSPAFYKLHLKSKAYLFRMPVTYGSVFKNSGFDILSLANNHIGDFGDAGRNSTAKVLDSLGIKYAGLLNYPSVVFEKDGIKYGFCSFAPNSQTVSILDLAQAAKIISALKQQCDIVIVSFHGGGEGPTFEHVTFKNESYFGERRGNVYAFAHNAIDNGADLIFGNGPHVSRGIELYKKRLIAYSLGNFCTYKSVSVEGVRGMAPLLNVQVNKKGEFLKARIISFKQTHDKGLIADTMHNAARRIKWLTETDFPKNDLNISATGLITFIADKK
jgi:poly-gamma-glutamate capsule biosynthesis protein CapA/YwtB (metallophosphatase superfamily)